MDNRIAKKISSIVGVFVIVAFVFLILYFIGCYPHNNNIYEDLNSGDLKGSDVKNITFIRHTKTLAVPWTQKGYANLENTSIISLAILEKFTNILNNHTVKGYSRPGVRGTTTPRNYIRVDTHYGFYYILPTEIRYHDSTTIQFTALPKNSTNPNAGSTYTNIFLVVFLNTYDPWYTEK